MKRPTIGWESETPCPNHVFNDYLSSRDGRLFFEDLDLAQLFLGDRRDQGLGRKLPSPLEIVYLPKIPQKIRELKHAFARAIDQVGYQGSFHYVYPSKANTANEVVRSVLEAGVNYEISTDVDTSIVRLLRDSGALSDDHMLICNGFKYPGSRYMADIIRLKQEGVRIIPIIEDLQELYPLIESGLPFEVGLRQKSYGAHHSLAEMDAYDSRFGMKVDDLLKAADIIAQSPNLKFSVYHAMVGSQIADEGEFVQRLEPPIEIYARLRKAHPSLKTFNLGGGVPAAMSLTLDFDYEKFACMLLSTLKTVCAHHQVPEPDVMGEFGRYTVTDHGAHLFKVVTVKENGSPYPWYIIDGSIMTSFPDTWALREHFTLLPVNHLDKPFRRVQLGGITCDSDDVYPPKHSETPLYLPVDTKELYIGFFGIGAYQEMLGGAGGAKHCVIPEANELIIDRDSDGAYQFQRVPGQNAEKVLVNLGYKLSPLT